jgi:hypothetical protein
VLLIGDDQQLAAIEALGCYLNRQALSRAVAGRSAGQPRYCGYRAAAAHAICGHVRSLALRQRRFRRANDRWLLTTTILSQMWSC